jgi:ferritin-like protein
MSTVHDISTCRSLIMPNELIIADTCNALRVLVSDDQCREACMRAGLNIPLGADPKSVAKLLCSSRAGSLNWSDEDGEPKGDLVCKT